MAGIFRPSSVFLVLLSVVSLAVLPGQTFAAETSDVVEGAVEALDVEEPESEDGDPLGRATPRGAVIGFLKAIDYGDTATAADYLDLRNLPSSLGQYSSEQLAMGLAIVLQRGTWIDIERLSNREGGLADDDLPSYRDLLVELKTAQKPVRVLLQRVPDDQGGRIWKFSNATMAELDVLYEEYRYNAFVEWLAKELPDVSFLTIALFKWVAMLVAVAISAPVVLLTGWWVSRLIIGSDKPLHKTLRSYILGPVSVFMLILIGHQVMIALGTGLTAQYLARGYTLVTTATIWLLWQGVNVLREGYSLRLLSLGRETSIPLLRPLGSAMKLVVVLLGVLVWLDNLGYQITAVLTGLGIGGIAVALVLQKPLEDIFGAITLYTQQPIKIGDFGRFGGTTGTVEEINLRTTRIRTLGNSLISVPNMRLAAEPIENLSARRKYLFQPVLRLNNDASSETLESLLEELRTLLSEHERVLNDGMRVRFTAISLLSFDVSVFAYIDARDWADFLAVAESLNLAVVDVLSRSGVRLASPLKELIEPQA